MKTIRHSIQSMTREDTECMIDNTPVSKCIRKMKQKSLSPILTESEKLLSTDDKKSSQPNAHIPVNNKNSSELIITMDKTIHIFICNPCGIRFSSSSTLGAHQTYYCSSRQKTDSELDEIALGNDTNSPLSSGEPSSKSIKTDKKYKCLRCSYSAVKKVSLDRHMRMHNSSSPVSAKTSPCQPNATDQTAVYCQSCDIRFTNQRTYQAHKMHYCGTRRVIQPNPPSSPIIADPAPPINAQPAYLALPTNPVIVIPYALVQNARPLSALPTTIVGPSPLIDAACIVQPDGMLQPIAQAIITCSSRSKPEEIISPQSKRVDGVDEVSDDNIVRSLSSSPLDLRLTRAVNGGNEQKKKRHDDRNDKSPLDVLIVQSKDPLQLQQNMLAHTHETVSKMGQKRPNLPARQQFFFNRGPSKCDSCNIVFCNYTNYVAHKKHYCASRSLPSTSSTPSPGVEVSDTDDADKTKHERSVPDLNFMEQDDYVQPCVLDENSTTSLIVEDGKIAKFDAETLNKKIDSDTVTKSTAAVIMLIKEDQPKNLLKDTEQNLSLNNRTLKSDPTPQSNPITNSVVREQSATTADQPVNRRPKATKQCRVCNISFNCLSTFIAHKKYYCRNSTNEYRNEYRFNGEGYVKIPL